MHIVPFSSAYTHTHYHLRLQLWSVGFKIKLLRTSRQQQQSIHQVQGPCLHRTLCNITSCVPWSQPCRSTANRTACICAPQDTLEDIYSIIISGGPKLEITQTSTNIKWTMAGYTVCISCVYMCVYIYVLIYIHKIKYYIVIKIKEW